MKISIQKVVNYFLEIDLEYLEKLHELHNDLPFWRGRMKIENVEKLVANFNDKTKYVIRIRNLRHALNHGLTLKKFIDWLSLIKILD